MLFLFYFSYQAGFVPRQIIMEGQVGCVKMRSTHHQKTKNGCLGVSVAIKFQGCFCVRESSFDMHLPLIKCISVNKFLILSNFIRSSSFLFFWSSLSNWFLTFYSKKFLHDQSILNQILYICLTFAIIIILLHCVYLSPFLRPFSFRYTLYIG